MGAKFDECGLFVCGLSGWAGEEEHTKALGVSVRKICFDLGAFDFGYLQVDLLLVWTWLSN